MSTFPEDIIRLEAKLFPYDRMSASKYIKFLGRRDFNMIVMRRNNLLTGYGIIIHRKKNSWLFSIASIIGKGYSILSYLEECAKAKGRKYIVLEVLENNTKAIAFYERNGYKRMYPLHNYYGKNLTALRYRKKIG